MRKEELVVNLVDKILRNDRGNDYVPEKAWRVSMIGDNVDSCMRQIQLRHRKHIYVDENIIEEVESRRQEQQTFTYTVVGSLLHKYIQDRVGQVYNRDFEIEKEVHIEEDGLSFIGHIDILLKDEQTIVELKTTTKYNKYLPNKVHVNQVTMYMKAAGVSDAVILYLFRDSGGKVAYHIPFDEERYQRILRRFQKIQAAEDRRELLPPLGVTGNEYPCKMCEWSRYCGKTS